MPILPAAGVAAFIINGVSYDVAQELSYDTNPYTTEWIPNTAGLNSWKYVPRQCHVKAKLIANNGIVLSDLNVQGATIIVQRKDGVQVVYIDASYIGDGIELNVADGTFDVEYASVNVTEIPA